MVSAGWQHIKLTTPGAFEVIDNLGSHRFEFAFVTAMSAQSGTHKPDQVYVLAHICEEPLANPSVQFEGIILQLSTLQYHPPEKDYLPAQPITVGPLRQYDSDRYAAHLLDLPGLSQEECFPVRVDIHLLYYQDISLGRVKVLGVEPGVSALTCTPSSHEPVEHRQCDAIQDQNDDVQLPGSHVGGGDDFDLLRLLDGEPPLKKEKKTASNRKEKQLEPEQLDEIDDNDDFSKGNSILGDPNLRAFLSEDDIISLREAQELCRKATVAESLEESRQELFGAPGDGDADSEGDLAGRE